MRRIQINEVDMAPFNHRLDRYIIIGIDLLLFALAHVGAYVIRFDLMMEGNAWDQLWDVLPVVMGIKLLVFLLMGVYRGMWRYVSINDLMTILKATLVPDADCGHSGDVSV